MGKSAGQIRTLSIDIGGTNIKVTVLNEEGECITGFGHTATPHPASPENMLTAIETLIKLLPDYHRISVGFPGYVRDGIVKTAPNLDTGLWEGVNLAKIIETSFGHPTRVVNDADMQGLGIRSGRGLELVITLGTGLGTALFYNGMLLPHLEFSHQPFLDFASYDQYIGELALEREGLQEWNRRVVNVLETLKGVFNCDWLYVSGGNAHLLDSIPDRQIKIASNGDGIKGGVRLWLAGVPV